MTFTVFTPTYNSGHTLSRVYDSLKHQSFKDFEWIIVNDGSTDDTDMVVASFMKEDVIKIYYYKQKNQGKHIAWNNALGHLNGKLFIPADADDSFSPDTLQFFYDKWNEISNKDLYSGINCLCYNPNNNQIIGDIFPVDGMDSNNLDLFYKYKIRGEKWGCIRTDLIKGTPFPVLKNNFYPESYIWFTLAKKYKVRCFNTPLRYYFNTDTGLISNLKNKRLSKNQLRVSVHWCRWELTNFPLYLLKNSPKDFFYLVLKYIKSSINYMVYDLYNR